MKPIWATGEGIEKKCRLCSSDFRDYTKKQKHNVCLGCWKKQNFAQNTIIKKEPRQKEKSGREYACRLCNGMGFAIDGDGCDDCLGTGMGHIEKEGMFLGRDE